MDGLSLVEHFQRLAVVTLAVADIAMHIQVGQKVHFHLDHAVALASLAAPALDVEGEAPRPVGTRTGFGQPGKEIADRRHHAGIGRRIGTRRSADG